jgi:hypothetical protein
LDKAYDAEEADELLESLGYTGHIKRRGEKEALKGVGEPFTRRVVGKRSVRSRG